MTAAQQSSNDEVEQFLQSVAGTDNSGQCSLYSDEEVDDAREEHLNGQDRRERRRKFVVGLVAGVTLLAVVAAVSSGSEAFSWRKVNGVANKYSVIDNAQPKWQIVTKERDHCSKTSDNCFLSKCCNVVGYKCYVKGDKSAKCMKDCTLGTDSPTCLLAEDQVVFEGGSAETMFCFSVYTQNTGSTKKSHEKDLLTQQHSKSVSIFACDAFAVYSDAQVSLGGGLSTIKVEDADGDFHFAKRKTTGGWVNTGMFKQVWKAIGRTGTYKNYAWTLKVDPDAVFLPARLVQRIRMIPRPENGIFLVNCRHVANGFFGNLEVFSAMAFSILVANVDKCDSQLPWKIGVKDGLYGPMGEDLFAEKCMEKNGVAKAEAFDITIDGACPADRPLNFLTSKHWRANCKDVSTAAAMHPFKKPEEYFECMAETQSSLL